MDAITKLLGRTPCDPGYDNFVEELYAAGYVIVPKEPTDEMVRAGWCDGRPGSMWDIYRLMLDAAAGNFSEKTR